VAGQLVGADQFYVDLAKAAQAGQGHHDMPCARDGDPARWRIVAQKRIRRGLLPSISQRRWALYRWPA
jgi:hypothetical protein